MKVELRKDLGEKNLWVLFGGDSNLDQAQIIVDLEPNDGSLPDVRIVSAPRQRGCTYDTSIVKVQFTDDLQVKGILRDDIFQRDIIGGATNVKKAVLAVMEANAKCRPIVYDLEMNELSKAVNEIFGPAKQRQLTGEEKADTAIQVDRLLKNYGLDQPPSPRCLRGDLINMVNVAKGGYP
jgi:hypothetical protein